MCTAAEILPDKWQALGFHYCYAVPFETAAKPPNYARYFVSEDNIKERPE
jgi:hypothetical protein